MKKLLMVSILALSATSFAWQDQGMNADAADMRTARAQFQLWKSADEKAATEKGENYQMVQNLLKLAEQCEKLNAGHDLNEKDALMQLAEKCNANSNLIIAAKIVASKSGFASASESEIKIAFNAALSKIQSLSVQINK